VAGCSFIGQTCACTQAPSHPPGGLSQEAAVAAAERAAPAASTGLQFVWASVERDPFLPSDRSDARPVWEVRLEGSLTAPPCPSGFLDVRPSSADKACLDGEGGLVAVLDYYSGAFVGWIH
jgi:hypothetical protein